MNKIDIDKQYRTRSGDQVEILKVGVANPYWSVSALITDDNGIQYIVTYPDDGLTPEGRQGRQSPLDLVEISPYDDFKIDEPVMVRDLRDYGGGAWFRRYFAGVDDKGRAKTWACGVTSWTIDDRGDYSCWDECRRPTPDEMKPV